MSKITENFVESALRHGVIVRSAKNSVDTPENLIYASVIEMANLGFKLNADDIKGMSTKDLSTMIEQARKVIGADRDMKPIYPGFPKQVQELSTITLLFEQLLHYWSHGELLPDYPDVVREGLPLKDMARSVRDTKVMTAKESADFFVKTLTTNSIALSENDKDLLKGSVDLLNLKVSDVTELIKVSKNYENIQSLVIAAKDKFKNSHSVNELISEWVPVVRNIDGVLRIVLALSTIPVKDKESNYEKAVRNLMDSKANSIRMVNLSRPSRRVVLESLTKLSQGFNVDNVVAHMNLWRRVMRMMHPYNLSNSSETVRVLDVIHENIEYKTFNSLVEEALSEKNVEKIVELLGENQPGNLLRRLVTILRMCESNSDAEIIAKSVEKNCSKSKLTTLVSAYNGVLVTNDSHSRLTRVAGTHNTLVEKDVKQVNALYISKVLTALSHAIKGNLSHKEAPVGSVNVVSGNAVPLVRRDLSTTDKAMDRGESLHVAEPDDTVRLYNHWRNNMGNSGYMDTGVVILDKDFESKGVITWDSWGSGRDWATYSGDKLVYPGDEAVEYIDVDLKKLVKSIPEAQWLAMTIQSWSGFPTKDVDVIAGVMVRSEPDSGESFDPRSVVTAFKPTTESLQSVPLAFNVKTGNMFWIDSSSGSTFSGQSASGDTTVGTVVYDEVERPRLTMGELAELWAEAHGSKINREGKVDKEQIMSLLNI